VPLAAALQVPTARLLIPALQRRAHGEGTRGPVDAEAAEAAEAPRRVVERARR